MSRNGLAGADVAGVGNGGAAHVFGDIARGYAVIGELGDMGEQNVFCREGLPGTESHGGDGASGIGQVYDVMWRNGREQRSLHQSRQVGGNQSLP